jgi:hypothetical protein
LRKEDSVGINLSAKPLSANKKKIRQKLRMILNFFRSSRQMVALLFRAVDSYALTAKAQLPQAYIRVVFG